MPHTILTENAVRDALEQRGVSATPQRVAVARWALNSCDHPTAEDVVEAMRSLDSRVSQATVYNTLARLVEVGLLMRVQRVGDNVRYDGNIGHHHHFFDRTTGRLHDIDDDAVQILLTDRLPADVHIDRISVMVEGTFAPRG